ADVIRDDDVGRVRVAKLDNRARESRHVAWKAGQFGESRLRYLRWYGRRVVVGGELFEISPEIRLDVQNDRLRRKRAGLLKEQLHVVVVRRHRARVLDVRRIARALRRSAAG